MPGRGMDQILPHPGDPELREAYAGTRTPTWTGRTANGPIPRPAGFCWPWATPCRCSRRPHPPSGSSTWRPASPPVPASAGKAVRYRMSPDNLSAAWPRPGRTSAPWQTTTCWTSAAAGWRRPSGAGRCRAAGGGSRAGPAPRPGSRRPSRSGGGRALVFSCGTASSGIPPAGPRPPRRPGVDLLPEPVARDRRCPHRPDPGGPAARRHRRRLHPLGVNWGYDVRATRSASPARLIDGGVDLIHGHSSHHPRPIEVTAASSSCTAAATASTTTRASPATRATATTCACCTSPRSRRAPASSRP